jgi:6-phosphogluconolactonase (cycloisomerase 2 family)
VANRGSDDVSAFQIHPTSGTLTPVPGSPFATGKRPFAMLVHPTGRFGYVVNLGSNTISAFTIDERSGSLTPTPGSPFVTGTLPLWPTLDPSGKFLYATNEKSNDISAYTVHPQTGALAPVPGSPFTVGPVSLPGVRAREATVDPTQRFLYLVNRKTDTISVYRINAHTGALTAVDGSPFPPCGKSLKYWCILLLMVGKNFGQRGSRLRSNRR